MSSRFLFPLISIGAGITPSDGAKLKFEVANGPNDKDTFEDEGLVTPNSNPVIANGIGHFPSIWVPDRARYRVILLDKNDVPIVTLDPVVTPLGNDDLVQVFDTVADMQADTSLKAGDVARFRNYFADKVGGGNEGVVVAAGAVDGGAFIDLPDTDPATRLKTDFPGGIVHVEQYGARGDDLTAAAANTIALNNANLNTLFKRVHYLGKKYSVDNNIMVRSGYQYRGIRNSTEIECLPDRNILISEAFDVDQGVGPTGELSIHNIAVRGKLTNLNQIGIVILDFAIDLQFVEAITCGGGGIHCVDIKSDGTELPPGDSLVNNRIINSRVSRCGETALLLGDDASRIIVTDFFLSDLIISACAQTKISLFAGSATGCLIENILFEGITSGLTEVVFLKNLRSTRILGCHLASFPGRGLVCTQIQGGLTITGLEVRANSATSGTRIIDLDESGFVNTTPSVIIEANVTLTNDTSGFAEPVIVIHNQSLAADITAKIATNGGFADQLVLVGGTSQSRIDRIRIQADTTTLGKITDIGNVSDQLGLVHDGKRLGYSVIPPGVSGGMMETISFPIKLTSFQELILRLQIIASQNDGSPVRVLYRQDLFISSRQNTSDVWFLGQCIADPNMGFSSPPSLVLNHIVGNDFGFLEVTFQFLNNDDFGILKLEF